MKIDILHCSISPEELKVKRIPEVKSRGLNLVECKSFNSKYPKKQSWGHWMESVYEERDENGEIIEARFICDNDCIHSTPATVYRTTKLEE